MGNSPDDPTVRELAPRRGRKRARDKPVKLVCCVHRKGEILTTEDRRRIRLRRSILFEVDEDWVGDAD